MDSSHDQDRRDDQIDFYQDNTLLNDDDNAQEEHAIDTSPRPSPDDPSSISFPHRKWNRLRKYYNDQYLELFKTTFDPDEDHRFNGHLPPTQLGAVLWHPDEKAKLYRALCRKGRHDLPALADLVSSKSVIEIKAYLDNLREQETDRQRFEPQPKNVSHAEILAAVEIGPACEAVLDRSADALLAFQDQYDRIAGQQANDLWLIDHDVSGELDEKTEDAGVGYEVDEQETDGKATSTSKRAIELFRLSVFLELSERLFMNKGVENPDSWQNLAEAGERPSLTLDTASLLYDLIVNFLRRLVQSCLFITQSRVRASTTREYRPRGIVRTEDVIAALDVLGVVKNARSYWVELARRNGLKIVDDAHRRGVDINAALAYDDVVESLSQSGRSRSVSAGQRAGFKDYASSEESSDYSGGTESEDDLGDNSEEDDLQEPEDRISPLGEVDQDLVHDPQIEGDVHESERHPAMHISRHQRLPLLEDDQDEYLEKMDQAARQQEEAQLLSLLGAEGVRKIKEEDLDGLGVRPREARKSVEDCVGWAVNYQGEWELRAKRRRLNSPEQ